MSKTIGNPRVYWIRMEMASCQEPDAARAEALSVLHDAYLAKGVAKAEMITDRDLIRLAAQSVVDAITSLTEDESSTDAAPGSAPARRADQENQPRTCRRCKYSYPLFSPLGGDFMMDCKLDKTVRNADHPACEKFEER